MLEGRRIAVVIPAYCEQDLILPTLASVPAYVDEIIVVDDASPDHTTERARSSGDRRVLVVRQERNSGVGAAIFRGYDEALRRNADVLVVMAGDNQMDPEDLPNLVRPILSGVADYVKGNRLIHPNAKDMPLHRRKGSQALALLTSLAAGVRVRDSQCGYTALNARAARFLQSERLWQRYGYPNDLLILLGRRGLRISEVPVRPVYATEKSGLRPWHLLSIVQVIARRWLKEAVLSHG